MLLTDKPDNRLLWLWLSLICTPGKNTSDILLDTFNGSIEEIYSAEAEEYLPLPGITKAMTEKLCDKSLTAASEINAYCANESIGILTPDSSMYPRRLARIQSKPLTLYFKGTLRELENEVCIAMVGTRDISEYGSRSAYSVSYDLAKAGAVVVSGMARGVDGMCHRGCIDAGGYTVAVLGCGIDRAYPSEHTQLMKEIIKTGLVITEYKPFTPPNGYNFPARNRIISGLSQGTVVIEAPKSSGALITAETALRQGRDIFAVPGKVGEINSTGTNELIKKGALVVTGAADILLEYQPLYMNKINLNNIPSIKSTKYRNPIEQKVAASNTRLAAKEFGEKIAAAEAAFSEKAKTAKMKPLTENNMTDKVIVTAEKPKDPVKDENIASSLPDQQKNVYLQLSANKPVTADEISRKCGMSIADTLAALTMLEIRRLASAMPGGTYILSVE